jgi:kumamolisin
MPNLLRSTGKFSPIIKWPNRSRLTTSYTPVQLSQRYGFPTITSQAPLGVAIIELGGGYVLSDFQSCCQQYGVPTPPITAVGVQGGSNAPTGDPSGPDGEVCLDIDVVAGATLGLVPIKVFFAPNTDAGFAAAIAAAAADPTICAISISWGGAESSWGSTATTAMEAAFSAAAAAGVVVFAASGDNGSSDGTRANATDYPASSPQVCGCGGTSITSQGEVAWNYGGGGFSKFFNKPAYQAIAGMSAVLANQSKRGVPDAAGDGDPNSGIATVCDGQPQVVGGTSGVAPLLASLAALLVAITGKRMSTAQFLTLCYSNQPLFTDIVAGSNGSYQATPGWDCCTGLGCFNAGIVAAMIAQLGGPPAPVPTPVPVPPAPVPPIPVPPAPTQTGLQGTLTITSPPDAAGTYTVQ